MIIIKLAKDLTPLIENQQIKGKKIGFVPTMGALHEGHLTLIRQSKRENGFTICSIFVNPTQFNNPKDFEKYPITIESDIDKLEASGCDLLFLPSAGEIYPDDYKKPHYELGYLETVLEGKFRSGHFQGVCQVVDRLLSICTCDQLYLGRKDYQQCMVINKLVELKNFPVKIRIVDTIREKEGLAMSSRNARLDAGQRKQALAIYETLQFIKKNIKKGSLSKIEAEAIKMLEVKGFKVDYVAITDKKLKSLHEWDGKDRPVALIAAFLGDVRLIDNFEL